MGDVWLTAAPAGQPARSLARGAAEAVRMKPTLFAQVFKNLNEQK